MWKEKLRKKLNEPRQFIKDNYKKWILELIVLIVFLWILQIISKFVGLPSIPIDLINAFITASSIILGFSFIVLAEIIRRGEEFNPYFVNDLTNMTKYFVGVLAVSLMILFANSTPFPIEIKVIGENDITLERNTSLFFLFMFVIGFLITGFATLMKILSRIKDLFGIEEKNNETPTSD